MSGDLIKRIETQLVSVVTSGSGDISERTIRQYGKTPVCREDIEALIARFHALEAQAALLELVLGRRKMEKVLEDWLDSDPLDTGNRTYALMIGEVRRACEVEDALLDAALAARGE